MPRLTRRAALVSIVAIVSIAAALTRCSQQPPAGAGDAVRAAFPAIHGRVYEVYSLAPDRDAVYDFLALSFTGDALTDEYVTHYTTLHRMQRERTRIRVLQVDYDRIDVTPEGAGWKVDADWSVGGIVTHQGHSHVRVNRYSATYELAGAAGEWRIAESRMRDLRRVRSTMGGDPQAVFSESTPSPGGFMDLGTLLRGGLELPDEEPADGTAADTPR